MSRTSSRRARTPQRRTLKSRRLIAAACLSLAALLCFVAEADACSWDYIIWMPHDKDADPLYRFVRGDHRAGYIDRTGRVVIEPKFKAYGNYGGEFHDGLVEDGFMSGVYADTKGNVVEPAPYRGAEFAEGLAAALDEDSREWGYVNRAGQFVISPRFPEGDHASQFSEGLAWVSHGLRYGFMDRTGEFVVEPTFLNAEDFHDGMARVVVEGPCAFVGDGPCSDSRVLGGAMKFEDAPSCKFTFVDARGSVLEARFDAAKDFAEGLAPVRKGGKWGFVDKSGRVVIEPRFDDAWPFSDERARIKLGELYGFIDRRGELVIPPRFDYAGGFSEGLSPVSTPHPEESRGIYYIDKGGRTVIPGPFYVASHFFKGLAHVELGRSMTKKNDGEEWRTRRFAYIDAKGKTVFAYEYEERWN